MAATKSMTKKPASTTRKTVTAVENAAAVTANPVEETKKRVFNEHDGIRCISCTAGELLIAGLKTKTLYDWHGIGDELEVEYGDLLSMVRSRSNYIFCPRIIINDQDFINQNRAVKDFYDSMYTVEDLNEIIMMSADQIREILPKLPIGAQDALKSIVTSAIDDGRLDSVNKIRVLDEFFGTKMLIKITSKE